MEIQHRYSTKECANGCGRMHKWDKKEYSKHTELQAKANICICSKCLESDNFTTYPNSQILSWIDKAVKGVDGYYLNTR
jgi:hypothetical protein